MKKNAIQRLCSKPCTNYFFGLLLRIFLFYAATKIDTIPAFKRKVQPEELWHYKYPRTDDIIPYSVLEPLAFVVPFTIFCINFLISHDRYDFLQANYGLTMAWVLANVTINSIKVAVGNLRPDFYNRCFPDGIGNLNMECTGDPSVVNEGRKSFPSGHSTAAFMAFGFLYLYLAGKLHILNEKGRGELWRICLSVWPLFFALFVAISRTCDYHHHFQDVIAGSLIGMGIAYFAYRQYYPPLSSSKSSRPYSTHNAVNEGCFAEPLSSDENEEKPLIEEEKVSKWI